MLSPFSLIGIEVFEASGLCLVHNGLNDVAPYLLASVIKCIFLWMFLGLVLQCPCKELKNNNIGYLVNFCVAVSLFC